MIAQAAAKMRERLEAFSGRLSARLSKPARRFVGEALHGIAARGSVRLTGHVRAAVEASMGELVILALSDMVSH